MRRLSERILPFDTAAHRMGRSTNASHYLFCERNWRIGERLKILVPTIYMIRAVVGLKPSESNLLYPFSKRGQPICRRYIERPFSLMFGGERACAREANYVDFVIWPGRSGRSR